MCPPPPSTSTGHGRAPRRTNTLASLFQQQLSDLALNLKSSNPHFIRCVKPNNIKTGDVLEAPLVLEQLRYSGVLEAIQVRKSGYPIRRRHADFWRRYWCLAAVETRATRKSTQNASDLARVLLSHLKHIDPILAEIQFGLTLVVPPRATSSTRNCARRCRSRPCDQLTSWFQNDARHQVGATMGYYSRDAARGNCNWWD